MFSLGNEIVPLFMDCSLQRVFSHLMCRPIYRPVDDRQRSAGRVALGRRGQGGFTLIEVVMVIVVLGVFAVLVAPRIFNSNDFYARGFHNQNLAMLRYAQKTAVAQRTSVAVIFNVVATPPTLTLTAYNQRTASYVNLAGPKGPSSVQTAPSGVSYSGIPRNFYFDALGQPVDAAGALLATQTIQIINAARTITLEAVTGFAHE